MNKYITHNEWELLEENVGTGSDGSILSKFKCLKCGNIIYRPKKYMNGHSTKCLGCEKVYVNSFINRVFGRLKIVAYNGNIKGRYTFICQCQCGSKERVIGLKYLLRGSAQSCGCLTIENSKKATTTHGLTNHPLYNTYYHLRDRCYNTNSKDYIDYGARGIRMCDEWYNNFINFYNWAIENGYESHINIYGRNNTSLDRIDVNGNYCPENCRWATYEQQANNKTNNHIMQIENNNYTLAQFCRIYDLEYTYTHFQLSKGIPIDEIIQGRKKHVIRFV